MNTNNSDNWTLSSRSEIRSANTQVHLRKRSYLKRAVFVRICLLLIFLVWYAVYYRFFEIDGQASFIYEIHDEFFIWLRGNFWVSHFPYSFVWTLPIAFAIAIFVFEYLTPFNPSKSVQRFVTIRMLMSEIGRRIMKIGSGSKSKISAANWENELRNGSETIRKGSGFTRRVLIEMLMTNRIDLIDAFESGDEGKVKKITRTLLKLSNLRVGLGAYGPVFLLGFLECLAIYNIGRDKNRRFNSIINKIETSLKYGANSESSKDDSTVIVKCLADMMEESEIECSDASRLVIETCSWLIHNEYSTTCELATRFLKASALILNHKLPEGRDLLESWTLRRYGQNCTEVIQAERLIYFAFWAKQIEEVALQPQMSGVVADLWPKKTRLADTGEEFANSGRLNHG